MSLRNNAKVLMTASAHNKLFPVYRLAINAFYLLMVILAVLISSNKPVFATPVTWTFSGNIEYSADNLIAVNDKVNGSVTFDTATPVSLYNAGHSAQYQNAITSISLSIPQIGVTYSLSNGAGHFSIQNGTFGDYEAILYANNWTGAYFSALGTNQDVTGIELFLRSFSDFLTPSGTNIPTIPYSLDLIPYTSNQNGLGATFEFYPGGDYVRGQITSLGLETADIPVPEPSTLLLLLFGLCGVGILGMKFRNTEI